MNYIAYHNTEKMGSPYIGPRHGFYTSKPVKEGQTVWVVTYLDAKRRDYALAGAFTITKIEPGEGKYKSYISGPRASVQEICAHQRPAMVRPSV